MNCPSRHDTEVDLDDGHYQGPNMYSADLTTRSDVGRIANARGRFNHSLRPPSSGQVELKTVEVLSQVVPVPIDSTGGPPDGNADAPSPGHERSQQPAGAMFEKRVRRAADASMAKAKSHWRPARWWRGVRSFAVEFPKFVGPGFMISVAYIDPGNYATDVAAGASYRFRLLCVILLSNLIAIFLQILCIKLGSVTGMNLSQMCRAHFPPWLNYLLYFFAEAAVIATDIAEVIGTAIALNLLINVPLVAGCAISIVGVLVILLLYRPDGGPWAMRIFEFLVAVLVIGVAICFCVELSLITGTSVRDVFRGYLPSAAVVQAEGLYQACGILGATVMPHSLFLGSSIVLPRLKEIDKSKNLLSNGDSSDDEADAAEKYRPSLFAIRACLTYSAVELGLCLFTFALFINSAILIVAGAALSDIPGSSNASLFGIYGLLRSSLAPAAGTVFALALLLSGGTAMIICTIAGQVVCEGHLRLKLKPWVRALLTRSLSIIPAIIIAGAIGREGLSAALVASQVCLSVILPVVSAPLLWFTCRAKYMTISGDRLRLPPTEPGHGQEEEEEEEEEEKKEEKRGGDELVVHPSSIDDGESLAPLDVCMRNNWLTTAVAIVVWLLIAVMNVALLVLVGLGDA